MLFDIDHFVEEANFLSQKSYKTDKKAIIINIQNWDKQCRVPLHPTKKQNQTLKSMCLAGKMTMLLFTESAKKTALFHE